MFQEAMTSRCSQVREEPVRAGAYRSAGRWALAGRSTLVALAVTTALIFSSMSLAGASSTPISGSAYGVQANVTLPLSAPLTVGPTPSVTLPGTGATQNASVASVTVATLLSTGPATVT